MRVCQYFFYRVSFGGTGAQECFAPSDQSAMPRRGHYVKDNDVRPVSVAWRTDKDPAAFVELVNASRVPGQTCVTEGGVTVEAQVWDAGAAWELLSESA